MGPSVSLNCDPLTSHAHFTGTGGTVALTKHWQPHPALLGRSISTPSAVVMRAKSRTKHTGPSSITVPDVASTLPHCETIKVKKGRGFCSMFLWWGIYTKWHIHTCSIAVPQHMAPRETTLFLFCYVYRNSLNVFIFLFKIANSGAALVTHLKEHRHTTAR